MNVTIADLLKLSSFKDAQLRAGKKQTDRFVRIFSNDLMQIRPGTVFVVEDNDIDLSVVISSHPEAAGFLIPKSHPYNRKSSLPVIAVDNCSACHKEWFHWAKDQEDLSISLFHLLDECSGDPQKLLAKLKTVFGCELYLIENKNNLLTGTSKLSKKALNELLKEKTIVKVPLLKDNETIELVAHGTNIDLYGLICASHALEGIFALKSHVITATRQSIANLIYEGERKLACLIAEKRDLPLPEDGLIWLFHAKEETNVRPWIASIREFCHSFSTVYLLEQTGKNLLLVLERCSTFKAQKHHMESLAEFCDRGKMPLTLINSMCAGTDHTPRELMELYEQEQDTLHTIFPTKQYFEGHDIFLGAECRRILKQDGNRLNRYRCGIEAILHEADQDMLEMLEAYFLDNNMSVGDTASMMYLHRNTVKYRLQRVEDILCIDLSNAVSLREITILLAIARLMG